MKLTRWELAQKRLEPYRVRGYKGPKDEREIVPQVIYAFYKGDEFIATGTADEIAKIAGVRRHQVVWGSTQAYKENYATAEERVYLKIGREDDFYE